MKLERNWKICGTTGTDACMTAGIVFLFSRTFEDSWKKGLTDPLERVIIRASFMGQWFFGFLSAYLMLTMFAIIVYEGNTPEMREAMMRLVFPLTVISLALFYLYGRF